MTESEKFAEIRKQLADSGLYFVGDSPWPSGAVFILTVGSTYDKLHLQTTAQLLSDIIGVPVAPLTKHPQYPNLYYFAVDLIQGTQLQRIDDLETAVPAFEIVSLFVQPLLSETQSLWWAAQLRADSSQVPQFLPRNAPVASSAWCWLQVRYRGRPAQSSAEVVASLVAAGFRAVDPLSGVSGFFENLFWAEDYAGPDYVNVLFNPGPRADVSALVLQTEVFDALGNYTPEVPRAECHFFMTTELESNQDQAESMAAVKNAEGSVGDVFEGAGSSLQALTDIVGGALKAVPYLLYGVLILGAAFLGFQGYKLIRDQWKTRNDPSFVTKKLARR